MMTGICMKGFVSHIMKLSGKSKTGSQEAKNKKRNRKAGLKNIKRDNWTGIVEWDCNKDRSLGGLNFPLMPKQQAPWLSYKSSQEKGKWAWKAVSIWTSKMESGCLGRQLSVIPSEICLPGLHPQCEEHLPGTQPSNICLWEEQLFGVEYHSHTRNSCMCRGDRT